ncbi:hypothetical protein TIFTF001_015728 [Ficus carica]|uniref:F-box domain-containing protein n=1 Tax=Ficus carica TaxID=3494 RepID=A0AA88ASM1_FICCA|nr:hypothetical protein TIFTF001_015728 [Ficus carica]
MATSSSNFNNLPREIAAEIMARLPPESLMECKCLNKSWYFVIRCLIKDPEFVAKHLHHAKSSPATLLVYYRLRYHNPMEKRLESPELIRSYELMTSSLSSTPSCENSGEKDNSFCLIKDTKTLTLCNIALRDFGIFHPETDLEIKYYRILGTGFGCDLGDGSYKIVRLLEPMIAEVFTPGTTNSWRQIAISIDHELYGNLESYVYLKGKCFWLMLGAPRTAICFNVSSEVFHTVPLPNEVNKFEESCSRLTVRGDSICLFWFPEEIELRNSIHMWEMDVNKPLLSPKSDDGELLIDAENDRIFSYNIRTRQLRKLHVHGTLGPIYYSGPYVKSSISVKWKTGL